MVSFLVPKEYLHDPIYGLLHTKHFLCHKISVFPLHDLSFQFVFVVKNPCLTNFINIIDKNMFSLYTCTHSSVNVIQFALLIHLCLKSGAHLLPF